MLVEEETWDTALQAFDHEKGGIFRREELEVDYMLRELSLPLLSIDK